MKPVIGSTFGILPERMTLAETRKWESGMFLWLRTRIARQFLGLL